jgi:hypothetical protein
MEKTNVHLAGSQEYAPAAQRSSEDEAERLAELRRMVQAEAIVLADGWTWNADKEEWTR